MLQFESTVGPWDKTGGEISPLWLFHSPTPPGCATDPMAYTWFSIIDSSYSAGACLPFLIKTKSFRL